MASTKEIKNRIKSVGDTQKITNAMYLISSTKMRKARREAEETRPYFNYLRQEIRRMFAIGDEQKIRSRFYDTDVEKDVLNKKIGLIVITADKGLAGAYNQNIVKQAEVILSRCAESIIYVVGDFGWRYFRSNGYVVDETFEHSMNEPSLAMARDITNEILVDFGNEEFDSLYVCYTEYKGGMSAGEVVYDRLLPFDKNDFVPEGEETDLNAMTVFDYEPNVKRVLERSIQSYLVGYIYSALVNSYSSEQNARMMAMEAANDNAVDLLSSLQQEYNHIRQNAITQEITEISSGARSLKKNRG